MTKRKFSDDEKVKLAIASLTEGVVINDFCTRHGISRSLLYRLRKAVMTQLSEGLRKK